MNYYCILRPLIFSLDPETAHNLAINALAKGLVPPQPDYNPEMLQIKCLNKTFRNPIGLAAGFDKNAKTIHMLAKQGFGFAELGTVTPKPQPGNPKPRLFRLIEDEAIINRLGFNNEGLDNYCANLRKLKDESIVIGGNIGKNKDSANAISDYVTCLQQIYQYVDYITINISSPNTVGLRDLQQKEQLANLLTEVTKCRKELQLKYGNKLPIFVKISPDINAADRDDIIDVTLQHSIDGLVISNTTISRAKQLTSSHCSETGGLSGRPLLQLSTKLLADIYKATNGKLLLIGVGGISTAEDAYAKIRAGASLIQIYSALIYHGFDVITNIKKGLAELLARDGLQNISDAVGVDIK